MKKLILLLSFFMFMGINADLIGQNYSSAVGLRLGYPLSLTYKQFIKDNHAIEGIVGTYGNKVAGYGYRWFYVAGSYQIYNPIEAVPNLSWYYGAGLAAYFWSWDDSVYGGQYSSTSFGIQGYLGLDYSFEDIPLNISVDWVPTVFLNGYGSGFGAGYGSLAARYILNQ